MYEEFLDFAVETALRAAEIQRSYFRGSNLSVETKSNVSDVVTRADKESEQCIASAILKRYPHHSILGEEGGSQGDGTSDYLWVVDPLDGTTNYSQGLPLFCVSIGLKYKGETIVGVVFAPYVDELFTAVQGEGAYMRDRTGEWKKISVSQKERLDISVIGTGFPYDKSVNSENNGDNVARIIPHIRDMRRMGSAAYDICCVACGFLDGYWELALHEWDVCAANLIAREAGAVICEFNERRAIAQIVGNETIVEELRRYVR